MLDGDGGGERIDARPWLDTLTRRQLLGSVRTLRQLVRKRLANAPPGSSAELFGAGSKTMSLLFLLSRWGTTARAAKPESIALPHPLFAGRRPEKPVLFRGSQGRPLLSVQIGWCSMEPELLLQNAVAAWSAVAVAISAVREIRLQELHSGLVLPVWLADRRRGKRRPPGALVTLPGPFVCGLVERRPLRPQAKRSSATAAPRRPLEDEDERDERMVVLPVPPEASASSGPMLPPKAPPPKRFRASQMPSAPAKGIAH